MDYMYQRVPDDEKNRKPRLSKMDLIRRYYTSRNVKLAFFTLIATVLGIVMIQALFFQSGRCPDWIHHVIYYKFYPMDYTPRGNVTKMRKLYKEYLSLVETPTFNCEARARYGNRWDGGWDTCDQKPYAITPPCLVHSWGINWDFSFDDDIGGKGNCRVYCFDPSMGSKPFDRSGNVHFYNFGIKGPSINEQTDWDLKTYTETLQYLGQERKIIDYLKMDVEGAEWVSLAHLSETGDIFQQIRQIGLEVHIWPDITEAELERNVNTLKKMRQYGLELYETHRNPCGLRIAHKNMILGYEETCCHEIYYVNTKFNTKV